MSGVLNILQLNLSFRCNSLEWFPIKSCSYRKNRLTFRKRESYAAQLICKLVDHGGSSIEENDAACGDGNSIDFPHVQTLRDFPMEELFRKVVMVRFDLEILRQGNKKILSLQAKTVSTITYLYEAGAKVILVGSWSERTNSRLHLEVCHSTKSVADFLSTLLHIKVVPVKFISKFMHNGVGDKNTGIMLFENLSRFKGEVANCSMFAKELASGVDIVVNDAFSQAHKVLASTVGVACFSYAYVAGFYFEEELHKMKKILTTSERPYMAIIGGGNFADKKTALWFLASACDGLVFVGSMAFQIMYALGIPVPLKLVEQRALKEAVNIVELAKSRSIPIILPKDIWCIKDQIPEQMKIFSVDSIIEGWLPVDIGPRSLQEMTFLLSKCKKITWIGPLKFSSSKKDNCGTIKLAETLATLSQSSCDITFVGKNEFSNSLQKSVSLSNANFVKNAAVAWEVLKGRKLPGLMALDRAYPSHVDWSVAYADQTRPLVVDVGSGNGLFVFEMARRIKDMNFLGLEINAKLVDRCLDNMHDSGVQNAYFIRTNATSTFRSIVSSYPGKLALVSIQCPNPDFNKPEYRWRMLQRSLVEAIADMLMFGGKVFIQSDIESVALRMKEELMKYSKRKLQVVDCSEAITEVGWLKENPFGVPSDWEQHVLERGDPMYRLLLTNVRKECAK